MNTKTISEPWGGEERRVLGEIYSGRDRRRARDRSFSFSRAQSKAVKTFGTVVFLGMLMLFVATLAIGFLSKQSIRLDEAQSLWQTGRSVGEIFHTIGEDVHVPLYHLTLHFWRILAGQDIAAARLLSLLFFLAMIPAVYHLGKFAYGKIVGMFGAFLVAISPFLNWYGNEARMYSMMAFFTVLNQYFFLHLFKGTPANKYWVGYALTAAAGVYTHYFFGLVLVAQAIFYLTNRGLFEKAALKKFVLTAAVIGLLFLPWGLFVYSLGSASNTRPQLDTPTTINLFNTFSEFLFGFQADHLNTMIVSSWPLAILLGFFGLRRNRKLEPETVYLLIAMTVPIVAAFALSFVIRPFFLARYMILALPSLYLFIGWLFSTYEQRLAFALKTFLIGAMVFSLAVQTTSTEVPVKENYREAVSYLNLHARPQDIVILSAPFTVYPVEYYYTGSASVHTLPIWNRFAPGPIPAFSEERLPLEVDQLKGSHQRAFLLLSYDQGYEETVRLYFDNRFERLDEQRFSDGLSLYAYKLRYDKLETANAYRPADLSRMP